MFLQRFQMTTNADLGELHFDGEVVNRHCAARSEQMDDFRTFFLEQVGRVLRHAANIRAISVLSTKNVEKDEAQLVFAQS
jgi:hypothetical protein